MKTVKLNSIDFECEIDERIRNDWRYMDYLTQSEDPALGAAERFRAINKAMELLLGMQLKEQILAVIAEKNDNYVSYQSVYTILKEIGKELGAKTKK